MSRARTSTAVLATVLILAGCSATGDATTPETPLDAPAGQPTGDPGADAQGADAADAGSEAPGPATLPACDGLLLEEGGAVEGAPLGACLTAAIAAQGTARMVTTDDEGTSTVDFQYVPQLLVHAVIHASGNEVYVGDGEGMVAFGGTWYRADPTGSGEEVIAHALVSAYRELGDLAVIERMVATSPQWLVGDGEDVTGPDDVVRTTRRLDAAAPFEWLGVTVTAMTLWVDEHHRIVRQETTSSALGFTATTVNDYYDWGAELDLALPTG